MKIFYVTDARIPTEKAHGYQIAKMCEAFQARGAEVHLVVPRRKNPLHDDPFDYYGIPRSFEIHYLPVLDLVSLPVFRRLPFSLFAYVALMATFLPAVRAFLRLRLSPGDILYTRSWEIAFSFSGYGNLFFEVHEILRAHRLIPRLYSRAAGVVAITTCLRDIILSRMAGTGRVFVAPDAVDLRSFASLPSSHEARRRLGLPPDRVIVGYVGMLTVHGTTEKGVADLMRAVAILHSRGSNPLLAVVGGPASAVARYRLLADSLHIGAHVVFPGQVSRADVPLWMRACDILAIPWPRTAFSACYTSPLKLFEYMAAGKPIVASDLPSLRDVLDERLAVFSVPGDPASLAAACGKLIDDPALRVRLGDAACRRAPGHTWDARAAAILAFISGARSGSNTL